MKIKELVYMVLDEIKGMSDDFTYTEDHVIFLLNKYRPLLLKLKYKDDKEIMHSSNFLDINVTLIEDLTYKNKMLDKQYKKSEQSVPKLLTEKGARIYPEVSFLDNADIALISEDRMRYVGYNKYLKNSIYATIHDEYLYIFSHILDLIKLDSVYISGVYEDAIKVIEQNDITDLLNADFPIEDSLVPNLIQSVAKELLGAAYRPKDTLNNAQDDLADIMAFVRRNMKNKYQKQLEGDEE